jgi:rod shape-determining protein MreD
MIFFNQNRPETLYQVSNIFILTSILLALFLNSLPWEGIWLMLRPDFVALVLLYWCMHKPLRIGIGLSWLVGIFADVANASLFGQHALTYTLLAFCGLILHRRLQLFTFRQQTSQVFAVFLLTYTLFALINWQENGCITWLYFIGCLTSTLLWIPISIMFQEIQRRSVARR